MKQYLIIGLLFCISCGSKIEKDQIPLLNGYWEIKEVIFKDGTKKEYSVNTTIDFIKIDSLVGYRKKVNPKFNGTYETSNDAEPLKIRIANDSIFMSYNKDLNAWEELILSLSNKSFSVINHQGITYKYERFEPININQ
ncbi:hypothetical protein [Maribacter hydrothermalis]|uniref:Lipocalin-like domain-containing protein n=1 Tax=Maribacter hydrothermalis TaxID=1836467 RepID=A0A1B7ZDD7_9FLAO|nr:hypothetical protein [Maribacter hydrothermalis]APQ18444.1 hypothetical protein BTR34_14460 [Maribacter hydrothermalis]OBR41350.1 hypothetical protein A9200_13635 [Maribacter hydrothermalis]